MFFTYNLCTHAKLNFLNRTTNIKMDLALNNLKRLMVWFLCLMAYQPLKVI